ncbi:hypothetical protein B0H13DRAFT_2681955 [Mycena leptocephala]|nr:hypothetical protein B0H13DRAFT_2681955 [Mycena leptocephala]
MPKSPTPPSPEVLLTGEVRRSPVSFKITKSIPGSRTSFLQTSLSGTSSFTNVIFRIFAHVFELTTTKEEKSEQAEEAKTWWQEGVAMKVIKNHGINAYMDDYVPLLNEFNSYRLVKVKFKLSKDEKEAENGSGEDEGEE